MRLSRNWLSEFTDVKDISDKDFAQGMTLSGSKVETVEHPGEEISGICAGRIVKMVRHQNSDHMWVCQVDVGEDKPLQIVTGAQNQKEGDLVVVARDGATLPGGVTIRTGNLRGELSCGMLCSYQELGFSDNDWPYSVVNGLFILDTDPDLREMNIQPGDDLLPVLGLRDSQIEFEITPNRPDCLSVIGLAREAAATFDRELKLHTPVVKGSGGDINDFASVKIENPELCPRYTARMVTDVKIAPSPLWLRQRLRAGGLRPISNIVDITNYVMLEYGQPMHAFDFSCVDGGQIVVRTAKEGETITTLDGKPHDLTASMLCICDEHKPCCVGGVMGGENSEIIGDTARVLFEAANFNGTSVRRTSMALGTRTDSSSRFEKGLDITATLTAVNRACELVEMLGCGKVVDGVIDVYPGKKPQTTVELDAGAINALLGTDISREDMVKILTKLDFTVTGSTVFVPSWRGDVERLCDLAEEVARFYGYNNIPATLQKGGGTIGGYSAEELLEKKVGEACRSCGYSEILTYSFVSPSALDKIRVPADSPLRNQFKILNPLGEDTSVMRTSALPSMIETLCRNRALRNDSVYLYETAKIYLKTDGDLADEQRILSLGAYGGDCDFYTIKGAVETVLTYCGVEDAEFSPLTTDAAYHPGRCAKITSGERTVGVVGQIHPQVAATFGSDIPLYCAEISLSAVMERRNTSKLYHELPRYPAVNRDLAVVADVNVTVGQIEKVIRHAAGDLLEKVEFFDQYRGAGIPEGKRSTAYSLTLRSKTGTLTDAISEQVMKNVLDELKEKLGAVLR